MIRVLLLSTLVILPGCNDQAVSWSSEDVIQTKQFTDRFQACADAYASTDRMPGSTFKMCLSYSYNLSMEK